MTRASLSSHILSTSSSFSFSLWCFSGSLPSGALCWHQCLHSVLLCS